MGKRDYPRYVVKLPLSYRKVDAAGEDTKRSGKYWTRNVSLGGFCFESKERLNHGTHLAIELHLPKDSFSEFVSQDPVQLKGNVVWIGEIRSLSNTFEVGVEFLAILEKDQERIEECLQFFLKQGKKWKQTEGDEDDL
jgi:hypothetical protein